LRRRPRLAVDLERDTAGRTHAAAVHAVARGRALAFATERVFGIGFHYDVVAGAAAAAKFTGVRRIATQLVLRPSELDVLQEPIAPP